MRNCESLTLSRRNSITLSIRPRSVTSEFAHVAELFVPISRGRTRWGNDAHARAEIVLFSGPDDAHSGDRHVRRFTEIPRVQPVRDRQSDRDDRRAMVAGYAGSDPDRGPGQRL